MSNLAIITARGGSKRIPKKNIRLFLGKPIIAYSIEAALNSDVFDEIMVSTDSQEIADIAIKCGAKVPFLRSEKNSDDFSVTVDVIEEVLLQYKKNGIEFNYVCCIYPTAPFVTPEKLKNAMNILKESKAYSVVPVVIYGHPIQRSFKINNNKLEINWPENINSRSQDLVSNYHDCGQFYCLAVEKFLIIKKLFTSNTLPLIISEKEVQDIDSEDDWVLAELKYKIIQRLKNSMLEFKKLYNLIIKDPPQSADAILWLQGDRYDRASKVIWLYKNSYSKKIIISGNNVLIGKKLRVGENNISLLKMKNYLLKRGVDERNIIIDNGAMNTKDQAEHILKIAKDKKWSKLLLVGSSYYQPRAFLTFLKAGKKMNWLGKIINQPFVIDWDKKPAGRDKTAKSLFNQEFKKIEKYKKDVITIYRGIKHLERNNK